MRRRAGSLRNAGNRSHTAPPDTKIMDTRQLAALVANAIENTPTDADPGILPLRAALAELEVALREGLPWGATALAGKCFELLLRHEIRCALEADGEIPEFRQGAGLRDLCARLRELTTTPETEQALGLIEFFRPHRNAAVHGDLAAQTNGHVIAIAVHGLLLWHTRLLAPGRSPESPQRHSFDVLQESDTVMLIRSPQAAAPGMSLAAVYEAARRSWRVSAWRAQTVDRVFVLGGDGRVCAVYRVSAWEPDIANPQRLEFVGAADVALTQRFASVDLTALAAGRNPIRYVAYGALEALRTPGGAR